MEDEGRERVEDESRVEGQLSLVDETQGKEHVWEESDELSFALDRLQSISWPSGS